MTATVFLRADVTPPEDPRQELPVAAHPAMLAQ